MSLFSDLNKANKIMMGLNESVEEPKEEVVEEPKEEVVEEEVVEEEVVEEPKEDEVIEEGKKNGCGKKIKEEEEEEEEEEEIDEAIQVLLEEGYSLVEANTTFYLCEDCGHLTESAGECEECGGMLEEAVKLVVKNGKVVKKKIKNRKQKMSAKQKQALKKAQKASQKSGAKKARAKSMKVRAKKGLDEGAEEFECPKCGFIGDMEEIEPGIFLCPECDVELEIDGQELREEVNEALEVYKRALDIPEFILNEGDDLVVKYLKDVFGISFDEE